MDILIPGNMAVPVYTFTGAYLCAAKVVIVVPACIKHICVESFVAVICVVALIAIIAGSKKKEDWHDDRQPSEHISDKENK